ncbi:hypothetical protein SPND122_00040 [Streptococcus pneumoniae]|nr:hypothetical protein SPND122_00040 [Streptococcus pneumoniae]AOG57068.1 hypothetical protein SPND141_00039 [Streptococcus pneumoniae]
MQRHVGGNYGF